MRQAVAWGLVTTNPAQAVRPPKPDRPRLEVPTAEQLLQLVGAAEGTSWEIPLLLAATTGARRGEVLAVRWADVDLDAGRLRITRALQRVGAELVVVDPKTPRARRQISLPTFALERLRRHRREQAERRLLVGPGWADLDLICDRGDGRPLQPDSWTGAFKRIAASAGLPAAMRLHDVRHGYATALHRFRRGRPPGDRLSRPGPRLAGVHDERLSARPRRDDGSGRCGHRHRLRRIPLANRLQSATPELRFGVFAAQKRWSGWWAARDSNPDLPD
jgi:integrase